MQTATVTYPARPQHADERIIKPSAAFKKEVSKVLGSILFFIVTYIVLVLAGVLLAVLCGYGGVMLVTVFPRLITFIFGAGLICLGVMVLYFLVKFLFKKNATDRSHLTELKPADQPELFNFVRTLTNETQSPFPKRIYISPEVNAYVFYDSSFWSMFFPVRKNLVIGLGLVNAVNLSEFKAILAHEFGHFSQRSMKLGSYVYNVNHVIHNMLYDNNDYGKTLEAWANVSSYFAFFASLTAGIVRGIQWVLQQCYGIVNKNYMSLSRQMEFHADSVSAYVSGANHLITSLRRLEVADTCYNRLFQHYQEWARENLKPDNVYPQHSAVMTQFANEHGLALQGGLPQVSAASFARLNKTRIVVKDQWASHPSTDDRETHLLSLNIPTETLQTPAWVVFTNAEALQRQQTEKLYTNAGFKQTPETLTLNLFTQRYETEVKKYTLNPAYKNFYNFRKMTTVNIDTLDYDRLLENVDTFEKILDEATLELPLLADGLRSDIHTLELIQEARNGIHTFEFEGKKMNRDEAAGLRDELKNELSVAEAKMVAADRNMVALFFHQAEKKGQLDKIKTDYKNFFASAETAEESQKKFEEIRKAVYPLYAENLTLEKVHAVVNLMKRLESPIKESIKDMLADPSKQTLYTPAEKSTLEEYVSKQQAYFANDTFLDGELKLFNESIMLFQGIGADYTFALKKELLDWQLQLLD
ncbi:M48 family metalloprotease [Chryseolinea lacunae]|uniref:M48 family metalloprotease n=1 Tax=Chryseolinea lacunae TaxID=2801331 RepID=A0ABS1KRB2_9BACT|nr:M48 family metallopeptidase [Chryseolinea lacunae]MBL0742015.1 M48 family metalloprotease [Chryseolinea lacunae]